MSASLFFCYSHRDESLRDQLEVHLAGLQRKGLIRTWHDRRITAGDAIDAAISAQLGEADVVLLLVSPDFIASDYCYAVEMTRALEQHEQGTTIVIPVILRPCDWTGLPFSHLLALPTDGRPITSWPNIDAAFMSVVEGINGAVVKLGLRRTEVRAATSVTSPRSASQVVPGTGPRSSNLRVAKVFKDRDRNKFLIDSFSYMKKFFENSIAELSKRNADIDGHVDAPTNNRFTVTIYRDGHRVSGCSIFLARDHGSADIRFSDREDDVVASWNESLSVDHDEQTLFLKPMGMLHHSFGVPTRLSMQGGAELFWGQLIRPLQEGRRELL